MYKPDKTMEIFDLAIAFDWEYDNDFIDLIEKILQEESLSTFIIKEHNVHDVTEKVRDRKLSFRFYLDRASDVNPAFEELAKILSRRKIVIINPQKKVRHAIDKASMHLEFINAGLNVPYSIIIPPHSELEEIKLTIEDLSILGRPFIIKPCNTTGGGVGVVTGAETLREIFQERVTNSNDKYLLQEKIYPTMLEGRRAWFRCFWAFGKPVAVWWDDLTHLYEELSEEEMINYGLKKLLQKTRTIAKITELDFFSTEIVLNNKNLFVVIDYVNDQCDMRIKSKHFDGVPDNVVNQIIHNLKNYIIKTKRLESII
ncbi:MAG: hypothetical protein A2V93_04865 [Ignavibacteria bacterium RBG_16_34_14]|nr:MAG: hypothetical protein A2V93_04865 [Ignavibacteria bacterium RBG_16_34_14]